MTPRRSFAVLIATLSLTVACGTPPDATVGTPAIDRDLIDVTVTQFGRS